jgi:hypothetical protein
LSIGLQCGAKIEMGFGQIGAAGKGLADQFNGDAAATLMVRDDSQIVERAGVARLLIQDVLVNLLGLPEAASVVMLHRQFERLLNRRLRHADFGLYPSPAKRFKHEQSRAKRQANRKHWPAFGCGSGYLGNRK